MNKTNATTTRLLRAECSCGRIIRASRKVLVGGPIVCSSCSAPFLADNISYDGESAGYHDEEGEGQGTPGPRYDPHTGAFECPADDGEPGGD